MGELLWVEHYLDAIRHLGSSLTGIAHYEKWFSAPSIQMRNLATIIGGASEEDMKEAAQCIRKDLRHHMPDAGYALDQARRLFSLLQSDDPDWDSLQARAEEMWSDIRALAHKLPVPRSGRKP